MTNKQKYPEVRKYWVYSIQIKSIGKFYIGVSKIKYNDRWIKSKYKTTVLKDYLSEWDSMIKTVLVDNLTKEEAYQYEGKIIDALSMNNLCINKHRSGLICVSDVNAYHNQLYKDNAEYREHRKQASKQWMKDNKEKVNEKQRQRYLKKKLEKQNQQMNLF